MIDDVVGETPVVLLRRVVPAGAGSVWLKLETRSPNGTVMDRVARGLARRAGPGDWVEAGDGALAIAVAMQAALHGRKLEVFLPEDTAFEVRETLAIYRAKVTLTPFAEGPAGARKAAGGSALSERFPEAEREALAEVARELAAGLDRLDAVVAPAGAMTLGEALRAKFPAVKAIEVRPFAGDWRPHRQAGVFPGPSSSAPSSIEVVSDEAAWAMRVRLGKEEGVLLSLGSAAAVEAACRAAVALGSEAHVCAIAAETGERSFSVAGQF